METKILSVSRLKRVVNPELKIPQTSMVAVSIEREKIEEIRKDKGISVKSFEKKIGLSRSRYYRWLQYENDLPMEFVIGIKKMLTISDKEFMELFVTSTDEQLQMLSVLVYSSLSSEKDMFSTFLKVRKELEKFRISSDDNYMYKVMLAYTDVVFECMNHRTPSKSLKQVETYFLNTDFFTLFDTILYLATLQVKQIYQLESTSLEKQIILLEKNLLKKINKTDSVELRCILLAEVLDLTRCLVELDQVDRAYEFIKQGSDLIGEKWKLESYDQTILKLIKYVLLKKDINTDDQVLAIFRKNLKEAAWCLPSDEISYLETFLLEELIVV